MVPSGASGGRYKTTAISAITGALAAQLSRLSPRFLTRAIDSSRVQSCPSTLLCCPSYTPLSPPSLPAHSALPLPFPFTNRDLN